MIDPPAPQRRLALAAILLLAVGVRLYHLNAPLLDCMSIKQVFVAQAARSIARDGIHLDGASLDFLTPDGQRLQLAEEVPLFPGLNAACYRLLGEHDWIGRAWSLLATLVAITALYDLTRRYFDERMALTAAFLFSWSPLLLAYGRAFQPDAAMLALMLVAGCCHYRYLDGRGRRWLVATAAAGMLAALCKSFGLMVLMPLAYRTWSERGWRTCFARDFVVLALAIVLPVGLWTALVFARAPNPTAYVPYFIWQMPDLLVRSTLARRFLDRFLFKSCGPIGMVLVFTGVTAALLRRVSARPMAGWTVMGLSFFLLLGPQLRYHVYYEMMMLPAAAVWAALGWADLCRLVRVRHLEAALAIMVLVVQSPLVMAGSFELENGSAVLGRRLDALCPANGRVLVCGSPGCCETIHYAHREGWYVLAPPDGPWDPFLARFRAQGATHLALYLSADLSPTDRDRYLTLVGRLPMIEERSGRWSSRSRPCSYVILDLRAHHSF